MPRGKPNIRPVIIDGAVVPHHIVQGLSERMVDLHGFRGMEPRAESDKVRSSRLRRPLDEGDEPLSPRLEAAIRAHARSRRSVDDYTSRVGSADRTYGPDELEFIAAMDCYIRRTGHKFPTWSEALAVARAIGYRKSAGPEVQDG